MASRSIKDISNLQIIFVKHLIRARVESSKKTLQLVRLIQTNTSKSETFENRLVSTEQWYFPLI